MKRGLRDELDLPVFSPAQVAALRLSIAAFILLPVSLKAFTKIKAPDWKYLAVVGLVGSGLPAILFTTSQQYLDSSIAGILNSLTPVFTLLIGFLVFKKVTMPRQVMGVLIGLGGAACLIALKGIGDSTNLSYSFLIVLATLFYGISVNTMAAKLKHIHPLQITAVSLLIAGIPWGLYLMTTDVIQVTQNHPHGYKSLGYICALAGFGTAMANLLYFWLTQQTTPLFASSVTYLMPLVAVGWGLLDAEILTVMHLLCAIMILSGVWLINKKP